MLFPFKRNAMLNKFISTVKQTKKIDAQAFWQFREFYYPGSLVVDKKGIKPPPFISPPLWTSPLYITAFRSKLVTSDEFLVGYATASAYLEPNKRYTIIGSDFAISESQKSMQIIFIKPIAEMTRANGFFDVKDKDAKLLKGKSWLVITEISK